MEGLREGQAIKLVSKQRRDADVAPIANSIVSMWQDIDDALSGVIGRGGVAALYRRSVRLASKHHRWLEGVPEGDQKSVDLTELKLVIEQQDAASAAAGGDALLLAFRDLLTSLIGPLLCEQLLGSVWAHAMRASSRPDKSP